MGNPKRRGRSDVVDVLRRERVALGLAQREVAAAAGFARETLAFWETGHRVPSLPALEDWARALGLKLAVHR